MPYSGRLRAWRSTCHDARLITAAVATFTLIVALTCAQNLVFRPQFDGVAASVTPKPMPVRVPRVAQPGPASNQPVVKLRLTSPAFGEVLKLGSTVTIAATVSGPVSTVHFCVNGRPIGTVGASPYRVDWVVSKAGWFRITAMTFDEKGVAATTSPVFVTVPETIAGSQSSTGLPTIRRVKGRG